MIKFYLVFLGAIITHLCFGQNVNYSLFNSIEEVIEFETSCISQATSSEQLSEAYTCRGESFLLYGLYEEAIEDLQKAYLFAQSINDKEIHRSFAFRVLFDQAIAYGNLNNLEMVILTTTTLKELIDTVHCDDCIKADCSMTSSSHSKNSTFTFSSFLKCSNNVPIYGPDQISTRDCIDFVNNTVKFSKLLIANASPSVQAVLILTIEELGDQASRCCRSGKGWKGCVQNLANKYHQWNQKWQVFGIPPDPSWD